MGDCIGGARHQDDEDEKGRDQDRAVVAREAGAHRRHRKSSSVFLTRSTPSAPMLTAASRISPSNSGCSSGAMSKMRKKKEITRRIMAPKIEPMALPVPPSSDVPPMTTDAIELSV